MKNQWVILFILVLSVSTFANTETKEPPQSQFFTNDFGTGKIRYEITPNGSLDKIMFLDKNGKELWPHALEGHITGMTANGFWLNPSVEKSEPSDTLTQVLINEKSIFINLTSQDVVPVVLDSGYKILITSDGEIIPTHNEARPDQFLKQLWTQSRWQINGQGYRGVVSSYAGDDSLPQSLEFISEADWKSREISLNEQAGKVLKGVPVIPEVAGNLVQLIPGPARQKDEPGINLTELKDPEMTANTRSILQSHEYQEAVEPSRTKLRRNSEFPRELKILNPEKTLAIDSKAKEVFALGADPEARILKYLEFAELAHGYPINPSISAELARDIVFDLISYPDAAYNDLVKKLNTGTFVEAFLEGLAEAAPKLPRPATRNDILSNPTMMRVFSYEFAQMLKAGFETLPLRLSKFSIEDYKFASHLVNLSNHIFDYEYAKAIPEELQRLFEYYLKPFTGMDTPVAIELRREISVTLATRSLSPNIAISVLTQNGEIPLPMIRRLVKAYGDNPTVLFYAFNQTFKLIEKPQSSSNPKEVFALLHELYKMYPDDSVHKERFKKKLDFMESAASKPSSAAPLSINACNKALGIELKRMGEKPTVYFQVK